MPGVQEIMDSYSEGIEKHVGGVVNDNPTIFAAVLVVASIGATLGVILNMTHGVDPISLSLLDNNVGYAFVGLVGGALGVLIWKKSSTEEANSKSNLYQCAKMIFACAVLGGAFFLAHSLASSSVPKILDPYMPIKIPFIGTVPMPPMWKITEAKTLMIDTIVNNGMAGVAMLFHSGTKSSKYRATYVKGAKGLSLLAITGALIAGGIALVSYGKHSVMGMSAPLLAEVIAGAGGTLVIGGTVLYSLIGSPEKEKRLSLKTNESSMQQHEDNIAEMRQRGATSSF